MDGCSVLAFADGLLVPNIRKRFQLSKHLTEQLNIEPKKIHRWAKLVDYFVNAKYYVVAVFDNSDESVGSFIIDYPLLLVLIAANRLP